MLPLPVPFQFGKPVPGRMVMLGAQEVGMTVPVIVMLGPQDVGAPQVVMLLLTQGVMGVGPYQIDVVGVAEGKLVQTRS